MMLVKTTIGPSTIQGNGAFAAEFIPKGMIVWKFQPNFDQVFSKKDLERLSPAAREQVEHYCHMDKGRYVLSADDGRFFNHSLHPNTDDHPSENATIAIRDIEIGEELTCNYHQTDERYMETGEFEPGGKPPAHQKK